MNTWRQSKESVWNGGKSKDISRVRLHLVDHISRCAHSQSADCHDIGSCLGAASTSHDIGERGWRWWDADADAGSLVPCHVLITD